MKHKRSYNSNIEGTSFGKAPFNCDRVISPTICPSASTVDTRTYHKYDSILTTKRNLLQMPKTFAQTYTQQINILNMILLTNSNLIISNIDIKFSLIFKTNYQQHRQRIFIDILCKRFYLSILRQCYMHISEILRFS